MRSARVVSSVTSRIDVGRGREPQADSATSRQTRRARGARVLFIAFAHGIGVGSGHRRGNVVPASPALGRCTFVTRRSTKARRDYVFSNGSRSKSPFNALDGGIPSQPSSTV